MKNSILILVLLCCSIGFSQENQVKYDEALAKSLHADEYGMKKYVFCLLKSGSNTTASKEETQKLFEGHMANINKLAKEGKLAVAGPFMKNDRNYRGIYIFNVETIEEAKALVATDPAIKANLLEAELTPWYCTAALQEIPKMHEKIAKTKM
ncbi:YciI family protein [Flavobacterium sp. KACC 22761]|uniref:YciI family protein n=1 Tax=Flavobacterium sp. KACC 22761 TaxID=3092665 RepID=UPI002A74B7C2|nr:YciI family protein [Flavobacterium sp. KACC 22761]WPO78999.1 YciI family protein [Flavobacterium sp. KACC 22761]